MRERQLTGKSTAIDFVYLLNSVPESAVTQAHISEKRQVHVKVDTTDKCLCFFFNLTLSSSVKCRHVTNILQ